MGFQNSDKGTISLRRFATITTVTDHFLVVSPFNIIFYCPRGVGHQPCPGGRVAGRLPPSSAFRCAPEIVSQFDCSVMCVFLPLLRTPSFWGAGPLLFEPALLFGRVIFHRALGVINFERPILFLICTQISS